MSLLAEPTRARGNTYMRLPPGFLQCELVLLPLKEPSGNAAA